MLSSIASRARALTRALPLVALVAAAAGLGLAAATGPDTPQPAAAPPPPAAPAGVAPGTTGAAPANPAAPVNPAMQPRPIFTPKAIKPGAPAPMPIGNPNNPAAGPAGPVQTPKPHVDQTPLPDYHPKGLTLFFMGQRNGEIEPCGCVKNQLGGMHIESAIYQMIPLEQSVRVDVGGFMPQTASPDGPAKAALGLDVMSGPLHIDAVNFSRIDLEIGKDFYDEWVKNHPHSLDAAVSANIYARSTPDKLSFNPYKIVERTTAGGEKVRCAIVGVTSQISPVYASPEMRQPDSAKDYGIKVPVDALKPVMDEIKEKADLTVLLAYATWEEVQNIAKAYPQVDVIISPLPAPTPTTKIEGTNTLFFSTKGPLGKQMGRVDLTRGDDKKWKAEADAETIGVAPKLFIGKEDKEVRKMMDELPKILGSLPDPPKAPKRLYAGASACVGCHVNQYQDWKQQLHSQALDTLVKKMHHNDAGCVKCHVVGFQEENGFWNTKASFHMGGVQCENCHGPAAEHADKENLIRNKTVDTMAADEKEKFLAAAAAARPKKDVPESTCIQCHQGENDPHFVYADKIGKVNHKSYVPPPATPTPVPGSRPVGIKGPPGAGGPGAPMGPNGTGVGVMNKRNFNGKTLPAPGNTLPPNTVVPNGVAPVVAPEKAAPPVPAPAAEPPPPAPPAGK